MSKIQSSEHEIVLKELLRLHDAGHTRQEACDALDGKRGISWVKHYWPSRKSGTPWNTKEERANNIDMLRQMYREGYSVGEAIKELSGKQSEHWVRMHWSRIKPVDVRSYSHMDVETKTTLVPINKECQDDFTQ